MAIRVTNRHSLGRQELDDSMRVASGDAGSLEGVIVTSHIDVGQNSDYYVG
jgi:hypothetical protein